MRGSEWEGERERETEREWHGDGEHARARERERDVGIRRSAHHPEPPLARVQAAQEFVYLAEPTVVVHPTRPHAVHHAHTCVSAPEGVQSVGSRLNRQPLAQPGCCRALRAQRIAWSRAVGWLLAALARSSALVQPLGWAGLG